MSGEHSLQARMLFFGGPKHFVWLCRVHNHCLTVPIYHPAAAKCQAEDWVRETSPRRELICNMRAGSQAEPIKAACSQVAVIVAQHWDRNDPHASVRAYGKLESQEYNKL